MLDRYIVNKYIIHVIYNWLHVYESDIEGMLRMFTVLAYIT